MAPSARHAHDCTCFVHHVWQESALIIQLVGFEAEDNFDGAQSECQLNPSVAVHSVGKRAVKYGRPQHPGAEGPLARPEK